MKSELLHPGWILAGAWALDALYGEYPNRFHPVVWMGQAITFLQKILLGHARWLEYAAGCLLLLLVSSFFGWISYFSIKSLSAWPWAAFIVAVFWLKSSFALRALGEAAMAVKLRLEGGKIREAQGDLRALCSRDASTLNETELAEASISSLAENLCDSVIAPLFYFILGGIPAAVMYRAVNTLDAMVGYKNHFRYLGWASARCDDLLNWIPARLTTLLLFAAGACHRALDFHALKVAWADHGKTPSPNGGWPMAAMAGMLRVELRKPGVYSLGTARRPVNPRAIEKAWQLTVLAGWMGFAFTCVLALLISSEGAGR